MCKKSKLENWKDWTSIIGSSVTALSFLFAAYQFYLGRQVLQAQAIHDASEQALQIRSGMLQNVPIFAEIYGVDQSKFVENGAVRQILGLYVVLYRDWVAGLIVDDDWKPIKGEICDVRSLEKVKPIVDSAIEKHQYPEGFEKILKGC